MKSFQYKSVIPVNGWGCHFDSLLEFRYALSVKDNYEFLRSRIPIYYDPGTRKPVDYIRYNTKRYTPDFLIRHKTSTEAFWVEIKPRVFEKEKQLILRRQLAETFIEWKSFDWKFKIVYDDEVSLSQEDQQVYNSYYRYKRNWLGGKPGIIEKVEIPSFEMSLTNKKLHFIMFGNKSPLTAAATGFQF